MRHSLHLIFFLFFSFTLVYAQDETSRLLKGQVKNDITDQFMSSVHVLNLSSVEGVITNNEGTFEIEVKAQDTLFFLLRFKPLKVPVSNDMIKFGLPIFRLTQLSYALEEVVVRPYQLTGYLDIDVSKVPLNPAGRYNIPGLPESGYEAGIAIDLPSQKRLDPYLIPPIFFITSLGKILNRCEN